MIRKIKRNIIKAIAKANGISFRSAYRQYQHRNNRVAQWLNYRGVTEHSATNEKTEHVSIWKRMLNKIWKRKNERFA